MSRLLFFFVLFVPGIALGHEVYVLSPDAISAAIASPSPDPLLAFFGNEKQFMFWGLVAAVVVSTVLFISVFRYFEKSTFGLFSALKRIAHPIVRITAGVSLLVYGSMGAFFGPEVPFGAAFGDSAVLFQLIFVVLGLCIALGFQSRIAAAFALLLFLSGFVSIGSYMLTYAYQMGAYMLIVILGGGPLTIDHRFQLGWSFRKSLERLSSYAFPILRVSFGVSIVFAALYAKYFNSNLALAVVDKYELMNIFPFDPLFIVLGAFIIEFLAGLMFIIGVEIRWTALFLVFWMTLGHLYLSEPWWVHIPLYGYGIAILCHGYDRFTLLGRMFKKPGLEPML